MRILFVTYDGPQVSYLEGLFLPIFVALRAKGIHFDVLQFRWGDRSLVEATRAACEEAGIGYRSVKVWRRLGGAGPFLSALIGARHVRSAVRAFGADIVMPRSLMPALSVLAAGGARLRPILFDADGLAADERVEFAGVSPQSLVYRLLRDVEAQAVRVSAATLVRSEAAKDILHKRAGPPVRESSIHVVTNGRDEERFSPLDASARAAVRAELRISDAAPLLVYAGSVGAQYRFDRMGAFAKAVRSRLPDTHLLVLSGQASEARSELVASIPGAEEWATFLKVPPSQVPGYLAAADLGIAYRSPSFSMQAVAPIKLSEYLLCGLPVVGDASVGHTAAAISAEVFFADEGDPADAAAWLAESVLPRREWFRQQAREVGVAHFSLSRAAEDYLRGLEAAGLA